MKIINAIWEKRNLGCNVVELSLEKLDEEKDFSILKEEVEAAVKQYKASYTVIKFNASLNKLLYFPTSCGFSFAEGQLTMGAKKIDTLELSLKLLQRAKSLSCEIDDSKDTFDFVAKKIEQGLFYTDRIALDSHYGIKVANKRYAMWLLDMYDKADVHLQIMKKNNEPFAFNLMRKEEKKAIGIVGGIFSEYQKSPLGLFYGALMTKNYFFEFDDIDYCESPVSSNNYRIIHLLQETGQKIQKIDYVFIKHY